MAITGGGPSSTLIERAARVVESVRDLFSPRPAPAAPAPGGDPAAAARAGVGAMYGRLDQLYRAQSSGGQAPPAVAGAGWPVTLDPVLRTDQDAQRIWGSEEALYGRATTSYGLTPQAYAWSGTDLTLETIAAIHRETDQMGILQRKADADFAINRGYGHLRAAHRQRIAPLYRSRLEVAPADVPPSLRPLAWALAAICRKTLDKIPALQKAEEDLASAAGHGYAGLEPVYQTPRDLPVQISTRRSVTLRDFRGIQALEWVHQRDFRWRPIARSMALDTGGQRYIDPFTNPDGSPTRKLIFHATEGQGDPHQRGYDWAALPLVMLAKQSLARWSVMLELFGITVPYIVWTEEGYATDEDAAAAVEFLGMTGRGRPGFLPRKVGELKYTETPQGVDARGQHAAILGVVHAELSKLVMAQTLSAETGGSGSYALANVMSDSKEEVQVIDAALEADTMTHQLLRFIVDINEASICRALGCTPAQIDAARPRAYRVVDRRMDPAARLKLCLDYEGQPAAGGAGTYTTGAAPAPAPTGRRKVDWERVAAELAIPLVQEEPQDDLAEQPEDPQGEPPTLPGNDD